MPKPRGKSMTMRVFVDSDHAGNTMTRRSRTGFVVFLNQSPIYWYSKKQGSCETSTFGSEFVAMKQACDRLCQRASLQTSNDGNACGRAYSYSTVKVAPAQMDGQGSRGEQPGKLRAKREAKAIMQLAGRDKFQRCNLHVIG